MVSAGRHKTARPVAHSSRTHQHRTQFKSRAASYRHINIRPAPDDPEDEDQDDDKSEEFILKDSLQTEIEEQLVYESKIARAYSPKSPTPRTFAEAAMSTRRGGRGRRDSEKDDGPEASLSGPMSLESLGPFKYTFKKKKKASKWAPLDLSTVDGTSEFGSNSEMGSSRAVSPSPISLPPPPFALHPDASITTPNKTFSGLFETNLEIDTDPTPTQERFDLAARDFESDEFASLDNLSSCDVSETQSTKDRTEAAMSRIGRAFGTEKLRSGNDAFDSMDWDPDLPAGGVAIDQSPEPVTATPKLVTYTTVGSVVDPDVVPQFTAPNRIQREGAGRRPLMMHPRQNHDYFQNRGPPPSLNTQNSMQYTQQLAQSPTSFSFNHSSTPDSGRIPRSVLGTQRSTNQQDRQVLSQIQIPNGPQMQFHDPFASPSTPTPSTKYSNNSEFPLPKFSVNHTRDEDNGRINNIQQMQVSGLEKMQTLQRLAKFDNPMQNLARSRLSEFSAAKSQIATPTPTTPALALELLLRTRSANDATYGGGENSNTQKPGELNLSYQFPPPGLGAPAKTQTNPLYQANSSSVQAPRESTPSHPPGYPQPLTAGPPGQRVVSKPTAGYVDQSWSTDMRGQQNGSSYATTSAQPSSPWSESFGAMTAPPPAAEPSTGGPYDPSATGGVKTRDTLPTAVVSKYYPYGFPPDMTGHYMPLTYYTQRAMGQIPDDPIPRNEYEKRTKHNNDLAEWFYSGQQRWGMTNNEHINELTELQKQRAEHPFGPIGPPPKIVSKNTTCTKEQLDEQTPTALIAPLLHATFRSLLANSESGAGTRKAYSNIGITNPFLIDDSAQGNQTVFGEDWGNPNKKFLGGSRY